MSQTLYVKKGRKYVPVREHAPEVYDSLTYGQYVVTVSEGSTRLRRVDTPASAEVLAAVEQMREAMETAMREANTSQFDSSTPLTPEQQAAADALRKSVGSLMVTYRGASMGDVVDAGVKVILQGLKHDEP
jgi:hypothetical protein